MPTRAASVYWKSVGSDSVLYTPRAAQVSDEFHHQTPLLHFLHFAPTPFVAHTVHRVCAIPAIISLYCTGRGPFQPSRCQSTFPWVSVLDWLENSSNAFPNVVRVLQPHAVSVVPNSMLASLHASRIRKYIDQCKVLFLTPRKFEGSFFLFCFTIFNSASQCSSAQFKWTKWGVQRSTETLKQEIENILRRSIAVCCIQGLAASFRGVALPGLS
jgi:hypothetical protein